MPPLRQNKFSSEVRQNKFSSEVKQNRLKHIYKESVFLLRQESAAIFSVR